MDSAPENMRRLRKDMRWRLPLSPEELEELANQDEMRLARMQEITQILPTLRL
jgi:hypothetical protein